MKINLQVSQDEVKRAIELYLREKFSLEEGIKMTDLLIAGTVFVEFSDEKDDKKD